MNRIPVNEAVQHKGAGPFAPIGVIIKRIAPSVGAPHMVLVRWDNGSESRVNERALKICNV